MYSDRKPSLLHDSFPLSCITGHHDQFHAWLERMPLNLNWTRRFLVRFRSISRFVWADCRIICRFASLQCKIRIAERVRGWEIPAFLFVVLPKENPPKLDVFTNEPSDLQVQVLKSSGLFQLNLHNGLLICSFKSLLKNEFVYVSAHYLFILACMFDFIYVLTWFLTAFSMWLCMLSFYLLEKVYYS